MEPTAVPGQARFTVSGLRWWIAILLMFITVINYLDRSALGIVGPVLKKELAIDEVKFALVVMSFQLVYGLMQPVAGRIIDWLNIRVGYTVAIIWWSIAQVITGFATGWRSLAIFRGVLGVGEAANFPGAAKTVAQWFPPKERTVAMGVLNMGSGIGQMVAPWIVVWIMMAHSWRAAFVVTGVIGMVWVVVWALIYRPPEKHPWLSDEERAYIQQGETQLAVADEPKQEATLVVLKQQNFWALAIARFFSEPAWQFFTYWIPMYLVSERSLNMKQVAYFAWVPFLAADLGCLFGGVLSPFFLKMGVKSVLTARKLAVTVPAVVMMLAVFIGKAPSVELAILFFSIGAFSHQAISSTLLTLPADLFPKRAVATANGMSGTVGFLGGFGFTLVVGIVAKFMGYGPLFVCIAFFDLIGAAVLWSLMRDPKTDPAKVAA
jgi:ACS family hexuronate transporter-like MFS transporter